VQLPASQAAAKTKGSIYRNDNLLEELLGDVSKAIARGVVRLVPAIVMIISGQSRFKIVFLNFKSLLRQENYVASDTRGESR
jgi:hypothetical protein